KSQGVLDEYGVAERDLTVFRYRGYGNPGRTRIETSDGRAFEKTYGEMWADEATWRIQTRCKLCPDAIGEAADLAAADIWPGGSPTGEDAGINGAISRTARGQALVDAAVAAGDLVRGAPHEPRQYDDFQPHQVAKKRAMAARLRGLLSAGSITYAHSGLRLDELDGDDPNEQAGAKQRVENGRFSEQLPDLRDETT
ncbi:MAG: Coenzyme F420 hydrogenase/dehydrogenase, beta subunit C-terminal domain, partial [Pseudomonadota bacterium]